jgi:hypothetical protein
MAHLFVPSPFKDVANGLCMPLAPASRRDTASIQRGCNLSQGRCARFLRFPDDGEHISGEPVGLGRDGFHRVFTGHMEPWIAKGHPASLGGREGRKRSDFCRDKARQA